MATSKTVLTDAELKALRRRYDPALVDALLTRIERADAALLTAVHDRALQALAERGAASAYDRLAIQRRTHEAALIKEEVRMFGEMATLIGRIRERYEQLTGTGRQGA